MSASRENPMEKLVLKELKEQNEEFTSALDQYAKTLEVTEAASNRPRAISR